MNELDLLIEKTAKELTDAGHTPESVSNGLAGLKTKTKRTYKNLRIETSVAEKFANASKTLSVTQTELLDFMVSRLIADAEAEKAKRTGK